MDSAARLKTTRWRRRFRPARFAFRSSALHKQFLSRPCGLGGKCEASIRHRTSREGPRPPQRRRLGGSVYDSPGPPQANATRRAKTKFGVNRDMMIAEEKRSHDKID
jgi:hypothetical protein